jgi:hypothetical protein
MIPGQSPPPPEELEPDQQLEWEAITARLPVDWFTGENIPMLKELCRHITYARELAKEIAEVKAMLSEVVAGTAAEAEKSNVMAAGRKELCGLLRAHGYQSERIGNLSTKLRLTKLPLELRVMPAALGQSRGQTGARMSAIVNSKIAWLVAVRRGARAHPW